MSGSDDVKTSVDSFNEQINYKQLLLRYIKNIQEYSAQGKNKKKSILVHELIRNIQPPELKEKIKDEIDEAFDGLNEKEWLEREVEKRSGSGKSIDELKRSIALKGIEIKYEIVLDNLGEAGLLLDKSSFFKEELNL